MKINRSTQIAGSLLAILLMAAGTATSVAQGGKLEARPLTHQDIHDYMLPADSQASGGLHTVGLGQPAYLEAMVEMDVTGITGVTWAITQQPMGATAALEATPLTPEVPLFDPKDREEFQLAGRSMLRPTVEGQYTVTATVENDADPIVLTLVVTAARYTGINTCSLCHSGSLADVPNKVEPWLQTDHAVFFTEAIDGLMSSHYNAGCIDCHVVGYDTNPLAVNGGFDDVAAQLDPPWTFPTELVPGNWAAMDPKLKNLSNIQCENCHGAGSQHALTAVLDQELSKEFIHVNYNTGDCAQCHSEEPYHVYPLQWENSKHAVAVREERDSCAGCHQGIGFIDRTKGLDPVRTEYSSINCTACHEPHDATNAHQLRTLEDMTLMDVSKPGGPTVITEGGNGKICMQCHISRRDAEDYATEYHSRFGPHHGPQTDMFVGANAVAYGKDIPSSAHREVIEDSCVTCHMQETSRTDPGHLLAGGHTWEMAYEGDSGRVDLVDACIECHGEIEDFDFMRVDYDGNGIVEGVQTEVKGLLSQVAFMLPPVGVPKPDHSVDNITVTSSFTPQQLKAAFNYLFVVEDGSWGVHNLSYAVGILKASIEDLNVDSNADGIADWWQQAYFGPDWASNPDSAPNATPADDDVPNWLKFLLNLDPTVPGVALPDGWILSCGESSEGDPVESIRIFTAAEVVFPTEVGMEYIIQSASSPGGGWTDVAGPIAGTGEDYSYLTSTRGEPGRQFFRVVTSPQMPAQ